MDGQAKCFEDQILADVFGLGSAMTTEGLCSLVLYYDHIKSITRNTQPLYICYVCGGGACPFVVTRTALSWSGDKKGVTQFPCYYRVKDIRAEPVEGPNI